MSLKYLIILHSAKKTPEQSNDILELLWKNGFIDSHILSEDAFNIWTLDSFMPYRRNCFELERTRFASFTPSNFTSRMNLTTEQLYPEKFINLNKCALYVAAAAENPFLKYSIVNGSTTFSGIDIEIITQISQKLNFRIVYNNSYRHGTIFTNGTVTGSLGLV